MQKKVDLEDDLGTNSSVLPMKKGSTVTKNGFYLHSYKPSAILECTIGWVGSGFKSASFFRETVHRDRVKIINPMY